MNKKITIGELNEIYQKYGDLGFKVDTPYGYKNIEWCGITEENADVYRCELENGMFVEGADYHRLKKTNDEFVVLKELKVGEIIQTKDGDSAVTSVELLKEKDTLYDIQVAEVHQYYTNGIVSHNTTLTIDAIKFLLHGSTTKTDKNEEIFNTFSDKNELVVRGMIDIEGDETIIERKMRRSAKKGGGWTVTNTVNYYEILPDGEEKALNEEDAKQTTKRLRETIGSEKDFELLVLATEKNLEDLIGLTTTESGKVITRLIGLEILELKEAAVRTMYNEFSKKKKSNMYDIITLNDEIIEHERKIVEGNELEISLKNKLSDAVAQITTLKAENDRLFNAKEKIDVTISELNPSKLEKEIEAIKEKGDGLKTDIAELVTKITEIGVVVFDEDKHHALTKELSTLTSSKAVKGAEITRIATVIDGLVAGGICQSCNRKLDDVDNTEHIEKHKAESKKLSDEVASLNIDITDINTELETLNETKLTIDKKNKLELDKDRIEVEIGKLRNDYVSKSSDIKKYNLNIKAIEFNEKMDIEISMVKTNISVQEFSKDDTTLKIERVKNDIISNQKILKQK